MLMYYLFMLLPWLAMAIPRPQEPQSLKSRQDSSSSYWVAQIQRQGTVAFGSDPSYQIFRNVKDYGAVGM